MSNADPQPFTVVGDGLELAGESQGDGSPILLLHGLTASRGYVVHGSRTLARSGFRQLAYDARGHGASGASPADVEYGYPALVGDLERVIDAQAPDGALVLAGHSMGAHTAIAYALAHPERVAGLVIAGPVFLEAYEAQDLQRWDRLADGLERGGIDGFLEEIGRNLDPAWRDTVLRFTEARMSLHRDLGAQARALREVPRSHPFESTARLSEVQVPTLVVASHDVADPHHPHAVAVEYAERIPGARLVSEEPGESPLAWQGGRFSREIASFSEQPAVAEQLRS